MHRFRPFLGVAAIAAFLALAIWLVVGWWLDKMNVFVKSFTEVLLERQFFPGGFNLLEASPFFFLALALIFTGIGLFLLNESYGMRPDIKTYSALGIAAVMFLAFLPSFWDNDKDAGRAYAAANTFVVEDLETVPPSLRMLMQDANPGNDNNCDLNGKHDVYSCIEEADISVNWEKRTVSATGAEVVLRRTTESDNQSALMSDTLTYLYNKDGSGYWTALRDGKKRQSIVGVMEWDGSADRPSSCSFEDNFELNMSWDGWFGTGLHDEIAKRYPELLFEESDVWGFCRKASSSVREPVIVIATAEQVQYNNRTATRSGGVIVVTGTPSGEPKIIHDAKAKPGEYPGPVYPASLAKKQRELLNWSAGRHNNWYRKFGYDISEVSSQTDNPSEYLLKSAEDGRLYWVTPMKPRSTDSQRLVAYSVIPADKAEISELNPQKVYVMGADDPRVVDIQRLETRAYDAVNRAQPSFFGGEDEDTKGKLIEFLPVDEKTWQVYAERGGNVVYRVDVPISESIQPVVTSVGELAPQEKPAANNGQPQQPGVSGDCNDPANLSAQALAQCLSDLAEELQRRQTPAAK